MRFLYILAILLMSCEDFVGKKNTDAKNIDISHKIIQVTKQIISENDIFYEKRVVNGKICAKKIDLKFKQTNELVEINCKNGQKVKKGQLLARLDSKLIKNQLEKSRLLLARAERRFLEEKINYSSSTEDAEIEKKLKLKSGLLEAQNNLQKTNIILNQTEMKVPFSGFIANLEKKKGDYITSRDVFCVIVDSNVLEVNFSIMESELSFIRIGQKLDLNTFTDKKKYKAVVSEINPIVKDGLIDIKAKITSKFTHLLDGMNVKVYLKRLIKNVIIIPKSALVIRSNKNIVFSLENGLSKWNYVNIVGENDVSYAISKGLKITDTIIVSGNYSLGHGARVNAIFEK